MIPPFNEHGLLPSDADATVDEIMSSHLVSGEGVRTPGWNALWRRRLVENLARVAELMYLAGGVKELWIAGSFVEDNPHPHDIDSYFVLHDPADLPDLADRLHALDPRTPQIWTWDCQEYVSSVIGHKYPTWREYRIDLCPELGYSVVPGPGGKLLSFAEGFRQRRGTFLPKGIIKLVQ